MFYRNTSTRRFLNAVETTVVKRTNPAPCTRCGCNLLNPSNSDLSKVVLETHAPYLKSLATGGPLDPQSAVEALTTIYREDDAIIAEAIESTNIEYSEEGEPYCSVCAHRADLIAE